MRPKPLIPTLTGIFGSENERAEDQKKELLTLVFIFFSSSSRRGLEGKSMRVSGFEGVATE